MAGRPNENCLRRLHNWETLSYGNLAAKVVKIIAAGAVAAELYPLAWWVAIAYAANYSARRSAQIQKQYFKKN